MKKTLTLIICLCTLILSAATAATMYQAFPLSPTATDNPEATVSVSPSSIVGPPPGIGGNFTVDINVENVTDLFTWSTGMYWNATVLRCLNFTVNYSFVGPAANIWSISGTINNTSGMVWPPYAVSLTDGLPGVNGSGTLAQVEFRVENYGVSPITLNFTYEGQPSCTLINSSSEYIPFNVVEGQVQVKEVSAVSTIPWIWIAVAVVVTIILVLVYVVMKRKPSKKK